MKKSKNSAFSELKKMKDEYERKLKTDGQRVLKERFKELFGAHPELLGVKWQQYTPYFNDGEACVFTVHSVEGVLLDVRVAEGLSLVDSTKTDSYDTLRVEEQQCVWVDVYTLRDKLPAILLSINEVGDELRQFSDLAQAVFGDHCEVSATRDGFKVIDIEHD